MTIRMDDTPHAPFLAAMHNGRHDGWTARRQRLFIAALAETGLVSQSAREVGMSARSAYRLRMRPDAIAFARAWDRALLKSMPRLAALAVDRALNGSVEIIYKDGEEVAQRRRYSDKLLMFLIEKFPANSFGQYVQQHPQLADGALAGDHQIETQLSAAFVDIVPDDDHIDADPVLLAIENAAEMNPPEPESFSRAEGFSRAEAFSRAENFSQARLSRTL